MSPPRPSATPDPDRPVSTRGSRPTEDAGFRDEIIPYFREKLGRTLSAEEAQRLVPLVRRKLEQLVNDDVSGVREALAHVLQIRILFELPLIPSERELHERGLLPAAPV